MNTEIGGQVLTKCGILSIWVAKGKFRPSAESGQKVSVTADQFDLIVFLKVMNDEQDKDIVFEIADAVWQKHKRIDSMSLDKGHWRAENRALPELEIPHAVLSKPGKRTAKEVELENNKKFKRLKNRHAAIESNMNELDHRGLDRLLPPSINSSYSDLYSSGWACRRLISCRATILRRSVSRRRVAQPTVLTTRYLPSYSLIN